MLAVQQANMDSKIWTPDTSQNSDQPFGFGFPMRLFPAEQRREPMPHTGSSCEIEVEAPTETRPATTKKRPHTKSRQGCLNCKARRVKVAPLFAPILQKLIADQFTVPRNAALPMFQLCWAEHGVRISVERPDLTPSSTYLK